MTLAAEQEKVEKRLVWLLEIELGYRIEAKTWTQADAPNTACWYMDHAAEGEPSRVRQLLRSSHAITTYTEKASVAECQATASTWFYDSSNGRLYLHASAGDAPDTASKYYLMSHFWHRVCSHQYESPNTVVDAAGLFIEPRLGKTPADVTLEINEFTEVGLRQSWGSVKIANADGKYDSWLPRYIWHMCLFYLKVGGVGDAYANYTIVHRGRTGSIFWTDDELEVGIEDSAMAEE